MKNALVVFNYNAGRKKAVLYKKILHKFLFKQCQKFQFIAVEDFETADIAEYDTIIAVGGDGTVNKVAKRIIGTDKVLAIIPSGTANLLASNLGIPSDLKGALKVINQNNVKKIDALEVNGASSVLRVGFGYDADIICKTPQSLKNKFGYFAYFIAGIIFALRLNQKEYEIHSLGQKFYYNASCIIVANSPNMYRNLVSVAPKSALDDNLFEVFILKTRNPICFFCEFLKVILGIKVNTKGVKYFQTNELTVKNRWTCVHIDGEKTNLKNNINIKISDAKLFVFCGR